MSNASDAGARPEEDRVQQAVLSLLLDAHPAQRSMDEILREMTDQPDDFAVRDLVGAGLAHRHGAFVFATRAAVRFDELQLRSSFEVRSRGPGSQAALPIGHP